MGGPSKGVASLRLLPRRLREARLRLKQIALVLLAAMCAAVGNSHDSNQVSMISQRCNALFLSIPSHSVEFRTGGAPRGHPISSEPLRCCFACHFLAGAFTGCGAHDGRVCN